MRRNATSWAASASSPPAGTTSSCAPGLPDGLRAPVSAFLDLVYGDQRPDDLRDDACTPGDADVVYAMRPATARLAAIRAGAVPWDELHAVAGAIKVPEMTGDRHAPDFGSASIAMHAQHDWIVEAAATGRGLVVVISA